MSQVTAHDPSLPNGKDKDGVKERVQETVEKGVEAVKGSAAAAQDTVGQATEQAGEELRKLTDAGTKFVRENPGAAIAGAVGVGILLGIALRNRD
ncbi:hypothetical protein [Yoonia litorea]|uniref:Membrane-anchored ribosome-binding protein, inhibits growth in stationary phase, ElaB/YqjD/DUF883 family n=1 Tax=Yoonia litorea TaxID=1123755 RepID=A0A1I6MZV1_9RHOB|nr:hypothetical protein [Yoonia litorea]SFS21232.1 hypothetical protein SAMN05444714_2774 [Yoonia litorea]